MKKQSFFKFIMLCFACQLVFVSCAKDPDGPEEETTTPTTNPPAKKFTWLVNGGTTVTADDSYFVPAFSNIYASKNTGSSVDINMEDLSKGTHNISASNGITLEYVAGTSTLNASSGSVVITENTGSRISGSFTCNLTGNGATTSLKGEFSNVPGK